MVDIFALALSHGLLALVAWRLLLRPDLDVEAGPAERPAKRDSGKQDGARPVRRGMVWHRRPGETDGDA
ncbi:hypothetical protein EDF56_10645 [Novosphingobium sp. PhB165]|uniref:hypothetical protein n=1 Tax=Novosphingobium sp. PhB165 TaxID=2485105 RepID=UPI0010445CA4|nr:hypothetical protein [Novosphingobium sp. PhB165]TCM16933.1 hypothetical protein EDF56_10645 [Novosphingobium sp. PhB165]